jgi:DNA-nicking Smr family endonuclease
MKFLLDCSENNSNLEDDSDFPEEFEGFVEAEPKKEEKPKKKLTQKEKEKEQKRQQREKEKERSIAHLREIFPSIDIEMIRFILKDAKWDATIAFQQLELQAGTSGIQSGAIKTNKKKFRPAQHLLGAANGHTANRWMENVPKITTATTSTQPKVRAPESTQSSLASRIKLEKLQNLTKDAGIPQGVVEIVFGECGTVSKTVQKLHEMYPDVTFNSHHDEQPQKQQPVAPSQLPKIHQTYRYNGGSEIQQSRTIAHDYAQIRNQFFQLALTAFMRGDGAKAKEFSDKGREADRISKEAHREAAQLTFEHMNRKFEHGTNIETMDMHGLRVDEALQQLDSFLLRLTEADEMSKAKSNRLNVITGLGKHSKNGAKIKPAVVQYFKDNDYKFREPWPGVIQCRLRRNQVSQY